MDPIDSKILRHLIEDGRVTNAKLAREVGLSESATLERVRRLEAAGIIGGYMAAVEPAAVGRPLEVLTTFTLNNQSPEDIQRFEQAMRELPEVLSCAQVLGRFDFLAHIAVRDIAALQAFIGEKLIGLGLIRRMESLTFLRMVKRYRPVAPTEGA